MQSSRTFSSPSPPWFCWLYSLPPSWPPIRPRREIVIGTTVGDFADMVTDSITPSLRPEAKVKPGVHRITGTPHISPWRTGRLTSTASSNSFSYIWRASAKDWGLWRPSPRVPTGPMGPLRWQAGDPKAVKREKHGRHHPERSHPTRPSRALAWDVAGSGLVGASRRGSTPSRRERV